MQHRSNKGGTGRAAVRVCGALALSLALLPAAAQAQQRRSSLAVSVTVQSSCRVSESDVSCSSGTNWSSATATRSAARPLAAARSVLGEPVRREGRIVLAAPAAETLEAAGATTYLTVTY